MQKVKYIIDQKESDLHKKQLFEYILKNFGNKATYQDNYLEVEKNDESKVLDFFKSTGLKYKKSA